MILETSKTTQSEIKKSYTVLDSDVLLHFETIDVFYSTIDSLTLDDSVESSLLISYNNLLESLTATVDLETTETKEKPVTLME